MLKSIRKLSAFALVLILLAAFLQACGGDSEESKSQGTPSQQTSSQGTPSQETPDLALPGPYPVGVTELTFERTSSTTGEPRLLKTLIWYPAASDTDTHAENMMLKGVVDAELTDKNLPLPVIMFSHGSGGIPSQSTYYTRHLASYGFVVVAPPHPGNTANDCFPCRDPDELLDSFRNRPDDITVALESMLALNDDPDSIFYKALDSERLGISGHSFGALDTLRMAAGDSRFEAALAMAPPGGNLIPPLSSKIDIPILIMGGKLDKLTPVEAQEAYFASLGEDGQPHFLLVFSKGGHLSFSDLCIPGFDACESGGLSQERAHELVNVYATAFFKTYLAKEAGYESYLEPEVAAGNSDIEYTAVMP